MKDWNFKVKNSPDEISKKLESSIGSTTRFVLNMDYNKIATVKFKIRKRLLYVFEVNLLNNIIVSGKFMESNTNNATDVEIYFTHHPLAKLLISGYFILGFGFLFGIIFQLNNHAYSYIIAVVLLTIGVFLIFHLKNNFNKNVQEYKKLISEILETQNLNYSE